MPVTRRVVAVLAASALVCSPAVAAESDLPTARQSTTAQVTLPQGSITLPPFTLPAKGACTDVPLRFAITGTDRMRIEVDITRPDGTLVAAVVLGRADAQRYPSTPIQVCRKATDDSGLTTVAIRPNTEYVFSVTTQVGGRHGPVATVTDDFRTGA